MACTLPSSERYAFPAECVPPGSPSFLQRALPTRAGPRPATNSCLPHKQLEAVSPPEIYAALQAWAFAPGTFQGADGPHRSGVSLPCSQALLLSPSARCSCAMVGREPLHLHGPGGGLGSQHAVLSPADAAAALAAGWGELHLLAGQTLALRGQPVALPPGLVMIYAPRDSAELEVVQQLMRACLAFCTA